MPKPIHQGKTPPVPDAWDFEVLEDDEEYEEKGTIIEKEGAAFYITYKSDYKTNKATTIFVCVF